MNTRNLPLSDNQSRLSAQFQSLASRWHLSHEREQKKKSTINLFCKIITITSLGMTARANPQATRKSNSKAQGKNVVKNTTTWFSFHIISYYIFAYSVYTYQSYMLWGWNTVLVGGRWRAGPCSGCGHAPLYPRECVKTPSVPLGPKTKLPGRDNFAETLQLWRQQKNTQVQVKYGVTVNKAIIIFHPTKKRSQWIFYFLHHLLYSQTTNKDKTNNIIHLGWALGVYFVK